VSIPHVIRTPRYGGEQRIEANPLLDDGERAWSYRTKQVKFGDGIRRWDDLPVAKIDFPALDEKLALPEMHRIAEEHAQAAFDEAQGSFTTDLLALYILAKS
jgi:hypothetical protein